MTIFRMNNLFDTAFIAEGKVVGRPNYPATCRTQLEVALETEDLDKLKTNPLGNHHLVIHGKYSKLINDALKVKNIRFI
ncbi:MAG: hypothetical protein Q8T08_12040 [Ignavibacteria bacterium]|nr:hypothetical protein [Ignavibacteria bacterium]